MMFDEILKLMRDSAMAGRVYLTIHANRELKDDDLTVGDVVNCLLTGEIIEQQFDDDRQEEKYLIYGDARSNDEMAVAAKLGYNKTTVVITIFRLRIMTTDINQNAQICVNCGKQAAHQIRRDELFGRGAKAVIIENIPMMKCLSCGIVYLEPQVSRMIDDICAHPESHVSLVEKQVAKIA